MNRDCVTELESIRGLVGRDGVAKPHSAVAEEERVERTGRELDFEIDSARR